MSKPTVIIDGVDYTEHVEELNRTLNGLNADGSGRDAQTGLMKRVKIADKWKIEIKMLRIGEDIMNTLQTALLKTEYVATVCGVTANFYTDTIPFGAARWSKSENKTYYDGVAFSMTQM